MFQELSVKARAPGVCLVISRKSTWSASGRNSAAIRCWRSTCDPPGFQNIRFLVVQRAKKKKKSFVCLLWCSVLLVFLMGPLNTIPCTRVVFLSQVICFGCTHRQGLTQSYSQWNERWNEEKGKFVVGSFHLGQQCRSTNVAACARLQCAPSVRGENKWLQNFPFPHFIFGLIEHRNGAVQLLLTFSQLYFRYLHLSTGHSKPWASALYFTFNYPVFCITILCAPRRRMRCQSNQ